MNRNEILERYNQILNNINAAKQKYNIEYDINIVAVSKYSSIETIKEFLSLDIDLPLGESKAQSLRDRAGEIAQLKNNVRWHFIGRIQSNKVKYIVRYADLIQSVDSIEIAEYINKEAIKNSKVQDILLQFNISDEDQKGGFNIAAENAEAVLGGHFCKVWEKYVRKSVSENEDDMIAEYAARIGGKVCAASVVNRAQRLVRMFELGAPECVVLDGERCFAEAFALNICANEVK